MVNKLLLLVILVLVLTGCGGAYDDGSGDGRYVDWGYNSHYRGATNLSRAISLDSRKEIAKVLLTAISNVSALYNNGKVLNTPLLLDNVTERGQYGPFYNLEEPGNCSSNQGKKTYNTQTFKWSAGFFRSPIKYENFCMETLSPQGSVTVTGNATEDEEFDNSTSGDVRNTYSETIFDNASVSVVPMPIYGIMTKKSQRSATYDSYNQKTKTVDNITQMHFGLDMTDNGTVYRFDFYYNPGSTPSYYMNFYHPTWGFVTVDLSFLYNDSTHELRPLDGDEYVTMQFDNGTDPSKCEFKKTFIDKDKPGQYPRWFNCKEHDPYIN